MFSASTLDYVKPWGQKLLVDWTALSTVGHVIGIHNNSVSRKVYYKIFFL